MVLESILDPFGHQLCSHWVTLYMFGPVHEGYVHAELHGASSTVIKNHKPMQTVPPLTLNQAGCFT
ncbi:nuclear export mediator factor NEMF-like, partial [Trifolium medium]|nr:nuclear export mediator factor NEMF-like [Trifolium medium]